MPGRPECALQNASSTKCAPISFERNVSKHAEGSCLVKFGDTHVLCTASLEEKVPGWMRNTGKGWVTAEYGMLPRSTGDRMRREATAGKQGGRTQEIQRLIGRSLRAVVDMQALGEMQITVDCDVIQADGGTRTASITGGWVALYDCLRWMEARQMVTVSKVLKDHVAAISCGIHDGVPVLDLDYLEDSGAGTDANFVMTGKGGIVEIQGTAEGAPFSEDEFMQLMDAGQEGHRAAGRPAADGGGLTLPMTSRLTPLWAAAHLPLKGGDQSLGRSASSVALQEDGHGVTCVISPLEGEMGGSLEGGV